MRSSASRCGPRSGGSADRCATCRPQELAATVIRALMERTGLPPESVEDVLLGHCYPTMDAPAIGRVAALDAGPAGDRLGPADRPALRLGPAGGALRGDAGAVRRLRRRPRRRRGVDEQRAVLLDRHALGRQGRPRRAAAGRPGPRPGDRRREEPPGARRHDRDGGEPARASTRSRARSRTSTPSAATSGRPPPRRRAGSPTRSCRSR